MWKTIHPIFELILKPFNYDYCGKGFQRKDVLANHCRIHTGEKPFKCELCDTGFATYSVLYQHMLIHTQAKQFKCEHCEKVFHKKCILVNHQRIHTTALQMWSLKKRGKIYKSRVIMAHVWYVDF